MTPPRGFSIVELVIVIGITGLLVAGVTALSGRFFTISREQFEQTRTTEEARIHSERMTDTIRNARSLNCDGNNTADQPNEWWLQTAEPGRLVVYSNIDADEAAERVTWEHQGSEIIRTIDQDATPTCTFIPGTAQVVARNIHNSPQQPLFSFVAVNGATITAPVVVKEVVRIQLQLIVDSEGEELANAAAVVTDVTPRLGQPAALVSPSISATPTPTTSPAPPASDRIRLRLRPGPLQKPLPEKAAEGPITIDEGEHWLLSFQYLNGLLWQTIDPTDAGLSVTSTTPTIVTVDSVPNGRLFGVSVGTGSITANYKGEARSFTVYVEPGCWGYPAGAWIEPAAVPDAQSMATICSSAGYSQYICGRTCASDPYGQPGSDVVVQHSGRAIVQQCDAPPRPAYGAQRFTHIFCSK